MVCFVCGRGIPAGKPFLCTSRCYQRWVPRIGGEWDADLELLEVLAALRVCEECAEAATAARVEWTSLPFPLLAIETESFYFYVSAGYHRPAIARAGPEAELPPYAAYSFDHCQACGGLVDLMMPHLRIEVAMNRATGSSIDVRNQMQAAIICHTCIGPVSFAPTTPGEDLSDWDEEALAIDAAIDAVWQPGSRSDT